MMEAEQAFKKSKKNRRAVQQEAAPAPEVEPIDEGSIRAKCRKKLVGVYTWCWVICGGR